MKEEYLNKYCELIIKVGVNLYEGQCLLIGSGVENSGFAIKLSEAAYKAGAQHVEVLYFSNKLKRKKIDNTKNPDYLNFLPNFYTARLFEMISNDWAMIRIDNLEELDDLKNADTDKLGTIMRKEQEISSPMSAAIGSAKIPWTIVAAPGPLWAAKVFNSEPSDEITEKLSEHLVNVLRLNADDPVKAWKTLGEKLKNRCEILDSLHIKELKFTGPGTDLTVGLNKNSIWRAGFTRAQNGRDFLANIPTEEVFTTPDFTKTNGRVSVTKPVKVLENLLTGIWFEFKDGKVIDYGADSHIKILEKYFSIDEGANYLGEVALVDRNSEIHKSGLIFNSILYDENAACHIALGRGITMCFSNKDELNLPEEIKKNGCNISIVHTDFMIGSDEVSVKGITFDGKELEIITKGEFNI